MFNYFIAMIFFSRPLSQAEVRSLSQAEVRSLSLSKCTLFILLAVLCLNISAAPADTTRADTVHHQDLARTALGCGTTLVLDGCKVVAGPIHWKAKEWVETGGAAVVAGGLYAGDQEINKRFQRNRTGFTDAASFAFSQAGEGYVVGTALCVAWASGAYFKNNKAQNCALLCMESEIISGVLCETIKVAAHRHRPSSNGPYNIWDGPGLSLDNVSFPSGHATTAFAWAAIVASMYPECPLCGWGAYALAALTGLSRIDQNEHWASDVFCGALLGWAVSQALLKLHSRGSSRHVMIIPAIQDKSMGIALTCY